MMVVKPGRWRPGFTTEIECTGHNWGSQGCEALLLLGAEDLFTVPLRNQDGTDSGVRLALFTCPQCGTRTEISDVPDGVLYSLPPEP